MIKPYKFEPYLKRTIWGGDRIAAYKGMQSEMSGVGESWEISGVSGHESIVADRGIPGDPDVGKTLGRLIEEHRGKLVGEEVFRRFGNQFPLLVKLIDAKHDLSVQVHPNDTLAMARHGTFGKTEMWYVIEAEEGAKIHAGLRQAVTPDEFEAMVRSDGRAGGLLGRVIASHDSHAGDVFFLPAGRLHAIGAGNFLAEIQQTSDVTYRVYDFGRRDASGNLRELHVEQARDAIDYLVYPNYRTDYDGSRAMVELVRCDYFCVNRVLVRERATVDFGVDSFVVTMCIGGEATVNGIAVRCGETLLVPASDRVLRIVGNAVFLTATIGPI